MRKRQSPRFSACGTRGRSGASPKNGLNVFNRASNTTRYRLPRAARVSCDAPAYSGVRQGKGREVPMAARQPLPSYLFLRGQDELFFSLTHAGARALQTIALSWHFPFLNQTGTELFTS